MADRPLVGVLMGSQSDSEVMDAAVKELEAQGIAVSYTHLTLPTILLV